MTDIVSRLKTPEECLILEKNAADRDRPDVALAARKRAVELQALQYGAETDIERECLEAVFAYERLLSVRNRKKTRASRTWSLVKRHGAIEAVERTVNGKTETAEYPALLDMGLQEYAFESVILKHPSHFSPEAVERAQERIDQHPAEPEEDDDDA